MVYGHAPPVLLPYEPSSARIATVDALIQDRDALHTDMWERLLQSQAYAKRYYDANHRALEFQIGDWVWLCVLHRPAQSLLLGDRSKLSPRYAGPFQVLAHVGVVAYKLQLREGARIHDVFHVGVLKPFRGTPPTSAPPLLPLRDGRLLETPKRVLHAQVCRGVWHILVQWAGLPEANATWEPVDVFRSAFPNFQLADELFVNGRSDVMNGITYQCRPKE